MPNMPCHRIIFALIVTPYLLISQNIDEAIRLFNSFQFNSARKIFREVVKDKKNPRIAEVYYYLARLSIDPDSALFYYNTVINNYPESRYVGPSYLEIAKYHIARNDYANAVTVLKKILKKFPDVDFKDELLFWLGVAYISMDKEKESKEIFAELRKNYPSSIWSERSKEIIAGEVPTEEYYTIQVGSYRKRANAEKYADKIRKKGFDTRVVEAVVLGRKYHRVWVGKFNSVKEAKRFSLKLDSLGIKGNVVKGY